jgi:hypothetical protein
VLVEERVDLPGPQLLLAHDVQQDCGVQVAAACPHHQPSSGVKPIDVSIEPPATDGRHRAAVAEVAGDEAQAGSAGSRPMSSASRRDTNGGRCRGSHSGGCRAAGRGRTAARTGRRRLHRLVEGGVEHRDLGHVAQDVAHRAVSLDVGRVVQRGHVEAVLDPAHDVVVDQDRCLEPLPAVHHAVAHGLDLAAVASVRRCRAAPAAPGSAPRRSCARGSRRSPSPPACPGPRTSGSRPPDVLDEPLGQEPVFPAAGRGAAISTSWNFTDELPQLRTRTFTEIIMHAGKRGRYLRFPAKSRSCRADPPVASDRSAGHQSRSPVVFSGRSCGPTSS